MPAEVAMLPQLVAERPAHRRQLAEQPQSQPGALARPAIGGLAVALGGLSLVVAVDGVTFLVAAVLIALDFARAIVPRGSRRQRMKRPRCPPPGSAGS